MKLLFYISLCCWMLAPASLLAQDDELDLGGRGDRIRAMRVAYITERMKMTADQSEKFWALHDAYEREQKTIRQKYRTETPLEGISNADAAKLISTHFDGEEAQLTLKRKYYTQFQQVVSPRQVLMYQKASREFNRDMLRTLQNRRRRG